MFAKLILMVELAAYTVSYFIKFALRSRKARSIHRQCLKHHELSGDPEVKDARNIVIIGASFAGYHAAKVLAESLPAGCQYQVVVVEPNSHFQFTWLLPRFSVVDGYESKLFIPYGPYIKYGSDKVKWIRDRAINITKDEVQLRSRQEALPWDFLIVATGSGQSNGLPSRVGVEDRAEGIKALQTLQEKIKKARNVVVVGGGAAGVELAADAKETYPEKEITLVHSRPATMHRFEPGLQNASRKALEDLSVKVMLGERVVEHKDDGFALLQSGQTIACDLLIDCVGQRPASEILGNLAPNVIASSGHIKVKSTLQIADDSLPNVYSCGDVAGVGIPKPNARAAMQQATIAADNIVMAVQGRRPTNVYKPHWIEGVIKLTLGLHRSVLHFGNGKSELLKHGTEKKITLMAEETWSAMGVPPKEVEA